MKRAATLGRFWRGIALALLCSMAFPVVAQEGAFGPLSSSPQFLYAFKDHVYFSADDGVFGRELWRVTVPEGKAEQVADITPGPRGSTIDQFYTFRDRLYFRVVDETAGGELWCSDGVPGGRTERVKQFYENAESLGLTSIMGDTGDMMLLSAGNPLGARPVWFSDGTQEGSYPSQNADKWVVMTQSVLGARWQDTVYFAGEGFLDQGSMAGVWKSKGTPETTVLVYSFTDIPYSVTALKDKGVFFVASTEAEGGELWVTQGAPESTHLVKDIWEGPETSDIGDLMAYEDPRGRFKSRVYFRATHPE